MLKHNLFMTTSPLPSMLTNGHLSPSRNAEQSYFIDSISQSSYRYRKLQNLTCFALSTGHPSTYCNSAAFAYRRGRWRVGGEIQIWMVMVLRIIILKTIAMLDEQFHYHDNSLDILLRFSTHSEEPAHDEDFFDFIHKQQPPTQISIFPPELDLLDERNFLEHPTTQTQLSEMQEACNKQEAQMQVLRKLRAEGPQKGLPALAQEPSDCASVETSSVRKTKRIRKEKQ